MEDSLSALNYLQTAVSDIIDHDDPEQTKEVSNHKTKFRKKIKYYQIVKHSKELFSMCSSLIFYYKFSVSAVGGNSFSKTK